MSDQDSNSTLSRRRMLQATGAAGLAGAAGCLEQLQEETGANDFEVLHGWSSGDGAEAFEALVEGFEEAHPDIEFGVSDVPGAARQNLSSVIQTRLADGDPPSTWQVWPGAYLLQFTEEDYLGDIEGDVWDEEMQDAYLEGPMEAARPDGTFVTVPLNIHRINNLFYNVDVIEQAGVDPTSIGSPSGLIDAFDQVAQNTDAVPFGVATGDGPWITLQLWATVFLGVAGPEAYTQLINGEYSDQATVEESLNLISQYTDYYPEDSASISFTEANSGLMEGNVAFIHQGDWAAGAYRNSDFEYESGFGHVPFPGTDGYYSLNMDSFPFPSDNPTPEDTKTFLNYVGSTEAQELFNPLKGSIPPRSDVNAEDFPQFLQEQIEDFQNSEAQPPSIAHGAAVHPDTQNAVEGVINNFTGNYNAGNAAGELLDAFSN